MINKDNWRQFVCHQPSIMDNKGKYQTSSFHILSVRDMPEGSETDKCIQIVKQPVTIDNCIYTEDEMINEVKQILRSMPEAQTDDPLEEVRWTSLRGPGNNRFENVFFYKGSTETDGPIFVINGKVDGQTKYAVIKHPNWRSYGVRMPE